MGRVLREINDVINSYVALRCFFQTLCRNGEMEVFAHE
jgi:hypothetical protein